MFIWVKLSIKNKRINKQTMVNMKYFLLYKTNDLQ